MVCPGKYVCGSPALIGTGTPGNGCSVKLSGGVVCMTVVAPVLELVANRSPDAGSQRICIAGSSLSSASASAAGGRAHLSMMLADGSGASGSGSNAASIMCCRRVCTPPALLRACA